LDVKTQKLKDDKKMIQKLGKRNQPSELGRKLQKPAIVGVSFP